MKKIPAQIYFPLAYVVLMTSQGSGNCYKRSGRASTEGGGADCRFGLPCEGETVMRAGRWLVVTVLGVALFVGCATTEQKPMAAKQKSLYERLGGKDAITAVVDDFVGRVAADTRINGFFATTDIPGLKRNLVNQICAASGGPCTYTGRDMKTAHRGMGVTNAHFDALVGDLVATLNKFKVPEQEKNELLAALGPMRKDIVER
jgi:hemoglobin